MNTDATLSNLCIGLLPLVAPPRLRDAEEAEKEPHAKEDNNPDCKNFGYSPFNSSLKIREKEWEY
ncbi:MAG TPA: hypothetical protein VLB32_07205 [Candidatus Acidoferrales bacterium]|nr:hypothetical protein [Candidatus Acidoferrales bacterium]